MNHDLEEVQSRDQTDQTFDVSTSDYRGTKVAINQKKDFGLIPAKPVSRIQKIKNALVDTIDGSFKPSNTEKLQVHKFDEECEKLRQSYSLHKKQRKDSKNRTTSNNARDHGLADQENIAVDSRNDEYQMFVDKQSNGKTFSAINQVNKYKRQSEFQNSQEDQFQNKYQRLEENFKKFTKSLQDKRQSRSPAERSKVLENATQVQPVLKEAKPVSVLGFVYLKPENTNKQTLSTLQRTPALRQVLGQTQHLLSTIIQKLQQLSVEKTQEQELVALEQLVNDFILQETEQENIEKFFSQVMNKLQLIFSKVMSRVYHVQSETFLNYKFKDIISLFETLVEEAYRLQTNELMPGLLFSLKMHRQQAACYLIGSITRSKLKLNQTIKFSVWKSILKRTQALRRIQANLKKNFYLRKVFYSFQNWANQSKQRSESSTTIIQKIILNQQLFADCLESDVGLSLQVVQYFKTEFEYDCDLLLFGDEDVTVYDHQSQQVLRVSKSVIEGSVTSEAIQSDRCRLVKGLLSQRNFNEKIDRPFVSHEVLQKYNKNVNILVVPLRSVALQNQCIGVLRILRNDGLTQFQLEGLKKEAEEVSGLIQRILQLRTQLGCLTEEIQISQELIRVAELEKTVQGCLFDILQDLQHGTKQEFLKLIKERTQLLLQELNAPGETILRQIFIKRAVIDHHTEKVIETPLFFEENAEKTLIQKRDHKKEQSDLLVDYLDYQKDVIIQQISIDSPSLLIILHKSLPTDSKRDLQISRDLKMCLRLLISCLEPVLLQGLKIHEELAEQVQQQSQQLYLQVQAESLREVVRKQLRNLNLSPEQEGVEKLEHTIVNYFDRWTQDIYTLQQTCVLVNMSVFNGQSVQQSRLVGYLNDQQLQILQLPQNYKISKNGECERQEVQQFYYAELGQEILSKDGQIDVRFSVKLQESVIAVVYLTFESDQNQNNDLKLMVQQLQTELTFILEQEVKQALQQHQFSENMEDLRNKISSLQVDIDFMQAVQETMILPFVKNPSLKTLGGSLENLTHRAIPVVTVESIQLLELDKIISNDIRQMEFQAAEKHVQEQLVYLKGDQIQILLPATGRSLLVKVKFNVNEDGVGDLLKQHCEVYQQIIQPFVKNALDSLTCSYLPIAQEHLPRTLVKILSQKQFANKLEFLASLKDLQLKQLEIPSLYRQIQDQKQQLESCSKQVQDLTSLLRGFQNMAPRLLGAPHFLCLILNEGGLAHFYQFQDSFIYNFKIEGTLIEEVVELECALELQSTYEGTESDQFIHQTIQLNNIEQETLSPSHSHKLKSIKGLLKTVTNVMGFRRIFYYPVIQNGKTLAVFEVGYHNDEQAPEIVMNEQIKILIDLFGMQLSHLHYKISMFCKINQSIIAKNEKRVITSIFEKWRSQAILQRKQENHDQAIKQSVKQQELCFNEYMRCLESYDQELKKLSEEKIITCERLSQNESEKSERQKLFGASLLLLRSIEKQKLRMIKKQSFQRWVSNMTQAKITEAAFNKMLELNFKHAQSRFQCAAFLLQKSYFRRAKKIALNNIIQFSNLTQLNVGGGNIPASSFLNSSVAASQKKSSSPLMSSQKAYNNKLGLYSSEVSQFNNILGPFQRSQLHSSNFRSSLYASGNATPVITNITVKKSSHLEKLHEEMGFGAVPKGVSRREGSGSESRKQKKSKSKSTGRSVPQVDGMVVK